METLPIKKIMHAMEGEDLTLCSKKELVRAIDVLDNVAKMDGRHLETLDLCHRQGPIWDGDLPSKGIRSDLASVGAIKGVSVKGEQGYNACTYLGYQYLKALCAKYDAEPPTS